MLKCTCRGQGSSERGGKGAVSWRRRGEVHPVLRVVPADVVEQPVARRHQAEGVDLVWVVGHLLHLAGVELLCLQPLEHRGVHPLRHHHRLVAALQIVDRRPPLLERGARRARRRHRLLVRLPPLVVVAIDDAARLLAHTIVEAVVAERRDAFGWVVDELEE